MAHGHIDIDAAPGGTSLRIALPARLLRTAGVLVAAMAVAGAALAVMTIAGGPPPDPDQPAFEVGIANPAPTSFGTVAVEYAQFLGGPTAAALTGATHNVGSLVTPDEMQVEATVTITNSSKRVVSYSAGQFELLIGSAPALAPTRSSAPEGRLQPDARIDERLVFAAPLSSAEVTLRYRENASSRPVTMRLGRHTVTPQRAHGERPGKITGIGDVHHAMPATTSGDPAATDTGHAHSGRGP